MDIDEILNFQLNLNNDFIKIEDEPLNILSFFIIFIIFYLYNILSSNKKNNFFTIILILLIFYIILIIINQKLLTNKNLTKLYIKPEILKDELNTGDIVLFRCFENYFLGFPILVVIMSLIGVNYFTHIGIIYKKKNGSIMIIESNADKHFCELSKTYKNGFQFMDFCKRVNETKIHRIHVVKSNLHQFLNIDKLNESITKYKDYDFKQDGVHCLELIVRILKENGLYNDSNLLYNTFEHIINPSNYNYPVTFNEPIKVKDPSF